MEHLGLYILMLIVAGKYFRHHVNLIPLDLYVLAKFIGGVSRCLVNGNLVATHMRYVTRTIDG